MGRRAQLGAPAIIHFAIAVASGAFKLWVGMGISPQTPEPPLVSFLRGK